MKNETNQNRSIGSLKRSAPCDPLSVATSTRRKCVLLPAKMPHCPAPFNAKLENVRFCSGLSRFLKTRNIKYLNLIDEKCGLQMNVNTDFADNKDGHCNIYGMEKVMDYVAGFLEPYVRCGRHASVHPEWDRDVADYEIKRYNEIMRWKKKK